MTAPWVPWALGVVLALLVAFVAVLIAGERRREGTVGRHSWLTKQDVDDSGGDLAAVTGLGEEREPTQEDREKAVQLGTKGWDLRGGRDVDPGTSNPWRDAPA